MTRRSKNLIVLKLLGILVAAVVVFLLPTGIPRGPELLIVASVLGFVVFAVVVVWFIWWLATRSQWPNKRGRIRTYRR